MKNFNMSESRLRIALIGSRDLEKVLYEIKDWLEVNNT